MQEIVLDTVRKAYLHAEHLEAGCTKCNRRKQYSFIEVDQASLADKGITQLRFRCSQCGRPAYKQVHSQVSDAGGAYRGNP